MLYTGNRIGGSNPPLSASEPRAFLAAGLFRAFGEFLAESRTIFEQSNRIQTQRTT